MEKVDLVIVGAEGVVESGGIINKVRFMSVNAHPGTSVENWILDMCPFYPIDRHLSDGRVLQSAQQAVLCRG